VLLLSYTRVDHDTCTHCILRVHCVTLQPLETGATTSVTSSSARVAPFTRTLLRRAAAMKALKLKALIKALIKALMVEDVACEAATSSKPL
jgi:hypothetical protein